MTSFDQTTLDFYDRRAREYVARGTGGASRWLAGFMRALPPGARVLELGCGGGRDAEALIANGFDVDPTDGSAAMAAIAAERLGRPVRVMRFDALSEIAEYDGIWANASLLHVPRDALGDVLARVFGALKPDGLHFASYKADGIAGRDSLGRYYNHPDRQALIELYHRAAPWDLVSLQEGEGAGYDDVSHPWLAITVRRALG